MSMSWTRRHLAKASLAGLAAACAGSRPSHAAARNLNVLCHRVHQLCLTAGAAGNLTEGWKSVNDADIAWSTFDTDPLQDRLFREASLCQTDFGVGYLVNSRATQAAAALLQPLGPYQSSAPIEEFGDIAPGLI